MKEIYETLIESYINDKAGMAENFLSETLAHHLRENLLQLFNENAMTDAGTGNEKAALKDKNIRSDKIYWLDRSHKNSHEDEFFDQMDHFVHYLNETCYTGITGYEFHYALYEKGTFYTRHLDKFKNDNSRQFSMITYLNPAWQPGDGGELCIHHSADHIQQITPNNRKSIFFKSSDLEHEVLETHVPRMSITGWLKK